jgi:hypothetical protein
MPEITWTNWSGAMPPEVAAYWCANTDCSRNFNDDVMANARAWWGTNNSEPPIDFSDMRNDECGFIPVIKND